MPRIQAGSFLYVVAQKATLSTMPCLSSSFHSSVCNPLSDVATLRAILACHKKALVVPHLDIVTRSFSSPKPANSPSSWDIFSERVLATGLTSRFLNRGGFSCPPDVSATYGLSHSAAIVGAKSGRFSSHATASHASDGRDDAHRCSESSRGNPNNIADADQSADLRVDGQEGNSSEEQEISIDNVCSSQAENSVGETTLLSDEAREGSPRRNRKGSPSRHAAPESLDLMTVPGIGRRNMEKLVANGIAKLDELKKLYRDKYWSDGTEKMVEFLRRSVGVQKHHATRISVFLKDAVDAEEDRSTESGAKSRKRLTFCVEGNISVGKTTFLHKIASETIELRDLVEVVPEPIGKWQDVGPDHFNILDAFYGDPERYAYTFQNYVFVTRMMQERESANGDKRLRLMERSVFSDRMVFVRAVHEAKWMSDAEISIYDSWFDPVVSAMPGLVPDAFIYLRATPGTCHRRLQSRNREEETNVTLEYLCGLHEKHEQWLFPAEHTGNSVLSVSPWPDWHESPLSCRLKNRVFYLQGENVHSSIQKVPALVLDCEPSIDFSRDTDAKVEYARQVADFFEYVQSMKDVQPHKQDSSPLILPRGGLLGPDGKLLKPNTVEGMDMRKQISTICV